MPFYKYHLLQKINYFIKHFKKNDISMLKAMN